MGNTPKVSLSIIVPVFNEQEGIRKTIERIISDLKEKDIKRILKSYEIIVVDDGSVDNTYKISKDLTRKFKNIALFRHKINQGLGEALRTGIAHTKKEYITYLPADGQVFLREIANGLEIAPRADMILTYRKIREDYNPYRQILSGSLIICMKVFFDLDFKDYNWVHIYKKDLFESIKTKSKGVFYLGEVVARTYEAGFKIMEIEASYHPRSTGVSKNAKLSVALQTLTDLLKLWLEIKFNFLKK